MSYGSYHRARARALARRDELRPSFVQMAGAELKYPWHGEAVSDDLAIVSLTHTPYEAASKVSLARGFWRLLDRLKPDVVAVCGYNELPMLAGALWARVNARASLLMFDTNAWDRRRPWYEEKPKGWYLRRCVDGVFCAGLASRQYLRQLGVDDSRIWDKYDVVDGAYFAQAAARAWASAEAERQRLDLPAEYFLFVGRFAPEKNLHRLLQAYAQYRSRSATAWKLVLVGEGPEERALRASAADLGLSDVVWMGRRGLDTLPSLYALAGALVLPSVVEPWGLVVNEAMACGAPILASTRCGCVYDLVREGGNGFTFDPYNPAEIADRMERMAGLDSRGRETMRCLARDIISRFTPEVWAANLADASRGVTGRRRPE